MRRPGLALFLLAACVPLHAFGHAIFASRADDGLGVCVVYDDGTPAAFSEVRLFAPGENDKPAYTGSTDRGGYFMFHAETSGVWRVVVDDGMGHEVTESLVAGPSSAPVASGPARMPRNYAVLTGLALLFGVFGWTAYLRLAIRMRGGG